MFFSQCNTVNEIKATYRKLCFIHHPDVGGETATMQRLNDEYHEALRQVNGETVTGSDNKPHTYYYSQDKEQAVMDKIAELLALNLTGVEILLVGTWLWVTGDTKPVKTALKSVKMRWHSKRKMWYWHTPQYKRRYNSKATFGDICDTYGVEKQEQTKTSPAAIAA